MAAPYGFGLSQEDEETDRRALELQPGDAVLCIASAGETPLSMLAFGADPVVAVDTAAPQLHLTALKLAAIRALDRADALAFLGFQPAPPARRRAWLDRAVARLLDAEARRFWEERRPVVEKGALWQGRYERYVRLLFAAARPVLPRRRLEALFEQPTLEAQREHFDRRMAGPALRLIFRVAFEPRLFRRGGMDPRSLQFRRSPVPLGEQYFQHFRAFCTALPARENPLLQLTLLGRIVDGGAAPACLTPGGFEAVRARHAALTLRRGDVRACLASLPPATFRKVQLSNLADWQSEAEFHALLRTVSERVARPGRVLWRFLHVDRSIPPDLDGALVADPALGERLRARDRFPFYGIVPVAAPAREVS